MNARQKYAGCFLKTGADSEPFQRNACLENFAGELTAIAYAVALQHGLGANWLEVQLELWAALTQVVKELETSSIPGPGRIMATQTIS